jgi:UPF0755 protein
LKAWKSKFSGASLFGKKNNKLISVIVNLIIFTLALSVITAIILLGVLMYLNSPDQSALHSPVAAEMDGITISDNGIVYFDVRMGESSQSVGLRLERAGLIRNRHFWNLISRLEKEHIKIGTYRLETPISQIAIQRILVSGRQVLLRVTIPEGMTLIKTSRILEDAGICSAEDFLVAANDPEIISHYRIPNTSMEGYLFPDTYLFPANFQAALVVRTMADNFFEKIGAISPSAINMSPQQLNEKVILASIVER